MTQFEVYGRVRAPRNAEPTVTLSPMPNPMIRLSKQAYDLLGAPKRVVLLWDREERIIGLRSAGEQEPNSYLCRPDGRYAKAVSARAFFRWAGIEGDGCRRVMVMEGGIGCVNLKQSGTPVQRRHHVGGFPSS